MPYLIYVLHCTGDTLYTGITPDLRRRMRQHCGQLAGGAKYQESPAGGTAASVEHRNPHRRGTI